MSDDPIELPDEVLRAYRLEGARLSLISTGWINRTILVERPTRGDDQGDAGSGDASGVERSILQRLHPVFSGEVNRDIDAITRHLEARALPTPRVVPTIEGALFVEVERPWRMLTHLPGQTLEALDTPARARSAGALVGRFHSALADLSHTFSFARPGAHDTDAHLAKLERVRSADLEERALIEPLTEAILSHPRPAIPELPTRIVHGDLKATNLLFEGDEAVALVDLDTLAHGTLAVELGDALRSWCNRSDESDPDASFDCATFEDAMEGYASSARAFLTEEEASSIVAGAETIALELASRFAADVYEDSYFGFDASRYPTRRAHNLARTRAQLSLARSIAAQRATLEAIVRRVFA